MIKITVNPESNPDTQVFNKKLLIIGCASADEIDIPLADDTLHPCHLKIEELQGRPFLINTANDPFATLNGLPFGKRPLQMGDLIQVGQATLRFDGICEAVVPSSPTEKKPLVQEVKTEEIKNFSEEFDSMDIEALTRVVDEIDQKINQPKSPPVSDEIVPKKKQQYLLHEFDDESAHWNISKKEIPFKESQQQSSWFRNWRIIFSCIGVFLLIMLLLASAFYLKVKKQSSDEEKRASEGVADVAMALVHARVHQIKPHNQNWSDPAFLRNNLSAILSQEYPALGCIDSYGHLTTCPYIFRVYTTSDLSNFVIIAQPIPTVLHWMIPKNAIVIDSYSMNIRKLDDLRPLNRLLVNQNSLEGDQRKEISQLISKGTIIPLVHLTAKKRDLGFQAPKALGLLKQGSENYIYNAPRYYQFSEEFITEALKLSHASPNSLETSILKHRLERLAEFPDLILYSSHGLQAAIQAQKILSASPFDANFLVAYLQFDSKSHPIGSTLLMDDGISELAMEEPTPLPLALPIVEEAPKVSQALEIAQPMTERQKALEPIAQKMINLIEQYTRLGNIPNFTEELLGYLMEYERLDTKVKIQENQLSIEQYQQKLTPIQEAITFDGLTLAISGAMEALYEGASLDSQEIFSGKLHALKAHVFEKLDDFLLSENTPLTLDSFKPENRAVLESILKTVSSEEEDLHRFYLEEFDFLSP